MINKLVEKIKKTNAPIVVGLDPMLSYVPEHIQKAAFAQFGETLEGAAEAIWQYNKAIVDATYDLIPAVKPQIAMYEQFGVAGVAVPHPQPMRPDISEKYRSEAKHIPVLMRILLQ